jgi:phosphoribosylformylglycinamidine synthase PurS subunit
MTFDVLVRVWLKPSVFDPQGNAVEHAISSLGFSGINDVRVGKTMTFQVAAADESAAEAKVREVCETVLCNPVIETYRFELTTVQTEAGR